MIIYPKNRSGRITMGLTIKEYSCRCSYLECRSTIISPQLVSAYACLRDDMGPFVILSGHRCARHNMDEGGSRLSRHQTGEAIDIALGAFDGMSDFNIEVVAENVGFGMVIIYRDKGFVHFDVRGSNVQTY